MLGSGSGEVKKAALEPKKAEWKEAASAADVANAFKNFARKGGKKRLKNMLGKRS